MDKIFEGDNKISEVHKKGDIYPLILNFQNGLLSNTDTSNIGGIIYNDNKYKKCLGTVLAIDGMIYSGTETDNSFSSNFIIARNRITGAVRAIEVGNTLLKAVPEEEQKQADVVDYSKDALGEMFGSKRRKRMLEQTKRTKIDMDTMKEQLEKTVSEQQINVEEMSEHVAPGDSMDKYAPPMNRAATNVKDVYKRDDLLSEEQMDTLRSTVNAMIESETYTDVSSEYVRNIIIKLLESTKAQKEDLCCLLLYADCIIRYLIDPYKKISNVKYSVCAYSELINKTVLNNFSIRSDRGWARPQSLKDKAICHVIVILLLSCDFIISDGHLLSKTLTVAMTKLTQMAKVAGAHVIIDNTTSRIVLKLPLAPRLANNFSKQSRR